MRQILNWKSKPAASDGRFEHHYRWQMKKILNRLYIYYDLRNILKITMLSIMLAVHGKIDARTYGAKGMRPEAREISIRFDVYLDSVN